ncbi:hypothetical protein AB0O31_25880 [Kitasatospora cineracea]|uniref:hypothetical protein n=1 Tax=Kitasatospora cineracea TaxID=88074 RepID=UPI0034336F57
MDASPDESHCGLCGRPPGAPHGQHGQHGDEPAAGAAELRTYVVVELRGALALYQAADDPSRTRRTAADTLARNLGVAPAALPGCRYTCWEEPAEHGVIQSGFEPA